MQTRDKKRNFFGGYRHGNRSMPKLSGQKSLNEKEENEINKETKKTQIEKALEKANTAVLFDSANNFKSACLAYQEAVILLQDVLIADPLRKDRPRLQNICDTYNERIRVLSKSIDPPSAVTTTTTTNTVTTSKNTNKHITKDTLAENSGVKDMRAITEGLSTTTSTSWRLGKSSKRKAKSRPTSMVHDESDDAASAYTVDSTKTTTSLFTSLFAKKGLAAKYKENNNNSNNPTIHHDLSSSVTLNNSGPKPSKSTPIAPFNRSPRTWLQQADRKKRHSSDSTDQQGNEQLPPLSLPLPELPATPNNTEDYFDLGSLGASDLLLNAPTSRYSALRTKTPSIKKDGRNENRQDYKKRTSQYVGIDLVLEEETIMDDTMDMIAKVMNESNNNNNDNETIASDEHVIIPPPRKQSIPMKQTEKDHRDDCYFLSTVEEEHCSKSSSSAGSTTTSSSLSLPSATSSPPLVPVPSTSTSSINNSNNNNNNNNGQGLSSFWRAHTFSTRRSGHASMQSPPQSPPPLSSRKKNKKHEPSLPPLHLVNNNNNPPPATTHSRASSTRTRSTSNASAKSRQSMSSPTTLSSPSSQTSNRNGGWSSFDLQSRSMNNASVASLVLSPKEKSQFFDPPKIDPAVFLSEPEPKAGVNDLPLFQRILKCLVEGGYLTDRLYVPKQLWNQPNIRLPSVDAKLAACEGLIPVLERMNAIQNDPVSLSESTKEIAALENVLEHIKDGFAKKLKLYERKSELHMDDVAAIAAACEGSNTVTTNTSSSTTTPSSTSNNQPNKTSQTFAAWGNKLSKSVERMKLESSRTTDHQHSTYIQALIQVFTLAQVLDSWRMQYTETIGRVPHDKVLSYAMFLTRLQTCADTLEKIVCSFVLRDATLLLSKWMKRSREWSLD